METLPAQPHALTHQYAPQMGVPGDVVSSANVNFDIWGLLNRRKWIVFLGLMTGLGAGYLVHTQTPPVYESKAVIHVEPINPIRHLIPANSDIIPLDDSTHSHDKIITSSMFVETVLRDNEALTNGPSFAGRSLSECVKLVTGGLTAAPDSDDPNIYYLSYRSANEDDAKRVLDSIVLAYEEDLDKKSRGRTREFVDLFNSVKAKLETEYREQREQFEDIRKEWDTISVMDGNGSTRLTLHQVKVRELDKELSELQAMLNARRNEQKFIQERISEGDTDYEKMLWVLEQKDVIQQNRADDNAETAIIEKWRKEISDLELLRNDLNQTYGPKSPKIIAVTNRIAALKRLLEGDMTESNLAATTVLSPQEIISRYQTSLEYDIAELDQRVNELSVQYQFHYEKAKRLENVSARMADKQEDINLIREWLTKALQHATEMDMSDDESQKGYNFASLARSETGAQVWPNIFIIVGMGGMIGAIAGFGLAYLVDIADKTFRSPDEITRQLGLPLIGHIPVMSTSKKYKTDDSLIDPVICTYHRPKSQSSEAFRAIRTALYFNIQGKQHSVIQVTSPTPGDGKSTVCCNLAVSIAQSGKRVLLVDGDMRRPTIHHMFGIKSNEGICHRPDRTIAMGRCRVRL